MGPPWTIRKEESTRRVTVVGSPQPDPYGLGLTITDIARDLARPRGRVASGGEKGPDAPAPRAGGRTFEVLPVALLRGGARAADALKVLGIAAKPPLPRQGARPAPALRDEAAIRSAGVAAGVTLAAPLLLEVRGSCEQRLGHYFRRRS